MPASILTGGVVFDGTGAPPMRADVVHEAGRIMAVGSYPGSATTADVTDVSGLVVCPGFVDIHSHSDLTLLSNPTAPSKVLQGVTTEVVGNCGLAVAPSPASSDLAAIRRASSYLDLDAAIETPWHTIAEYLAALEGQAPALNVATLTGHLPLRIGVVGFAGRAASPGEVAMMCDLLAQSLEDGSIGLSTGLNYAPASYADLDELVALGRTVAEYGRVFTWHLRDYGAGLLPAVQQCLEVARRTGCRTEISHLTAVGRRNWGSVARALELVDAARDEGMTITVDIYPYLHGNAPLAQLLPAWSQDGSAAAVAARLRTREARDAIRAEWAALDRDWSEIVIGGVPDDYPRQTLVGEDIASIAETEGIHPDEFALDLLADLGPAIMIFAGGRCERDLLEVLAHPAAVIASDGMALDPSGPTGRKMAHPRSYGCFPRYLARYVEPSGADFPDAVRRCTGAPARAAGLAGRGELVAGAFADIVVLAQDALADRATMRDPHRFPEGIKYVIVNGRTVVDEGRHTGLRPGTVIRAR